MFVWPEAVNLSVYYNLDLHSATVAISTLLIVVSLLLIIFLLSELKAMVISYSLGALIYTSGDSFEGCLRAGLLCNSATRCPKGAESSSSLIQHIKAG